MRYAIAVLALLSLSCCSLSLMNDRSKYTPPKPYPSPSVAAEDCRVRPCGDGFQCVVDVGTLDWYCEMKVEESGD